MRAIFFPFSRLIGALEREGYEVSGPTICRDSRKVSVYDRKSGELRATAVRTARTGYWPYVFMRQEDENLRSVAGRFARVFDRPNYVEVEVI